MKSYVLDTSVLSALGPGRNLVPETFREWVRHNGFRLALPTVVVAEISCGIWQLRRRGGIVRADGLARWLDTLVDAFGTRVVPLDLAIGGAIGELSDWAIARGRYPGFADIAIAATARVYGFDVLTRNLKHFQLPGLVTIDPFTTEFPPRSS